MAWHKVQIKKIVPFLLVRYCFVTFKISCLLLLLLIFYSYILHRKMSENQAIGMNLKEHPRNDLFLTKKIDNKSKQVYFFIWKHKSSRIFLRLNKDEIAHSN